MKFIQTCLPVILLSSVLSGCGGGTDLSWQHRPDSKILSPLRYDSDAIERTDLSKVKTLSKRPYSFELVRVHDRRVPEAKSLHLEDKVIYEYVPDKLLRGVEGYVGSALKRYLTFGPQQDVVFKVEYELRDLRTYIGTGDVSVGSFGRYIVELEADVIVRDEDTNVIFADTLNVEADSKREPIKGQHPAAVIDEKAMDALMRKVTRKVAIHTGWKVHGIVKDTKTPYVNSDEDIWEEQDDIYN